jgi:hypothetical protein
MADLVDGARIQGCYGRPWLIPYWLFAVPGFATVCAARVLLDSSARPGRSASSLIVVPLFAVGLYVAGVI